MNQQSKRRSRLLLSLLRGAGIGAALPSVGLHSVDALAQVSNTRHNLTNTNTGWNRVTGGVTNEVCVFCHTPHAAAVATDAPPLWNKKLATGATYTTYAQLNSATLDANYANGTVGVGSTSLACLSCHDGNQSMDNIVNAPGSNGYDSSGGGAPGLAWGWANDARADSDGKLAATAVTNLSADLRNDHPIGISYCGGTTGVDHSSGSTLGCRDGDFKPIYLYNAGTGGTASAQWYIETSGSSNGRDKTDLPLYTRSFSGEYKPSVECGSCHDPHVGTKATNQVAFLRVSQVNSGLCLACHNK